MFNLLLVLNLISKCYFGCQFHTHDDRAHINFFNILLYIQLNSWIVIILYRETKISLPLIVYRLIVARTENDDDRMLRL